MNDYKVTFIRDTGTKGEDVFTARNEDDARKQFNDVYRHGKFTSVKVDAIKQHESFNRVRKVNESVSKPFSAYIKSDKGFYIGDLCYVLDPEEYRGVWGKKYGYQNGVIEFERPNKMYKVAVAGTAYGDGTYLDNDKNEYSVDSGTISIAPLEIVRYGALEAHPDGRVVETPGTSLFVYDNGIFEITLPNKEYICIDTNYSEDDLTDDDIYSDNNNDDVYGESAKSKGVNKINESARVNEDKFWQAFAGDYKELVQELLQWLSDNEVSDWLDYEGFDETELTIKKSDPRCYENAFWMYADDCIMDYQPYAESIISFMSDDEVADFAENNGYDINGDSYELESTAKEKKHITEETIVDSFDDFINYVETHDFVDAIQSKEGLDLVSNSGYELGVWIGGQGWPILQLDKGDKTLVHSEGPTNSTYWKDWIVRKLNAANKKYSIELESTETNSKRLTEAKFDDGGYEYVRAKKLAQKTTGKGDDKEIHRLWIAYEKESNEPHWFITYGEYDDIDWDCDAEKEAREWFDGIGKDN